jgi:diacylglycerol kinase (ATP)
VLVIMNAAAGSTDARTVEAVLAVLRRGGTAETVATGNQDELDDVLSRRRDRRVVVLGGDGSLHAVVAVLYRRGELPETAVGLVPMGTGNDYARGVGLPSDPLAAAQVILDGEPRPVDLLTDDAGGVVVNAVHIGAGAEAALRAKPLKRRFGPAAFPLGAIAAGVRTPGWRLRIEADGEPVHIPGRKVLMVGLANTPTIAGGTGVLAPAAVPADGVVDVIISAATGPFARLGYSLHLRRGTHYGRDDVVHLIAHTVTVSGEPFPVNADGEVSGPIESRTWTLQPRFWRLIQPG